MYEIIEATRRFFGIRNNEHRKQRLMYPDYPESEDKWKENEEKA